MLSAVSRLVSPVHKLIIVKLFFGQSWNKCFYGLISLLVQVVELEMVPFGSLNSTVAPSYVIYHFLIVSIWMIQKCHIPFFFIVSIWMIQKVLGIFHFNYIRDSHRCHLYWVPNPAMEQLAISILCSYYYKT